MERQRHVLKVDPRSDSIELAEAVLIVLTCSVLFYVSISIYLWLIVVRQLALDQKLFM